MYKNEWEMTFLSLPSNKFFWCHCAQVFHPWNIHVPALCVKDIQSYIAKIWVFAGCSGGEQELCSIEYMVYGFLILGSGLSGEVGVEEAMWFDLEYMEGK